VISVEVRLAHAVDEPDQRDAFPLMAFLPDRTPCIGESFFFSPEEGEGEEHPRALRNGTYKIIDVWWSIPAPGMKATPHLTVVPTG
jgi:hypothetical protein